jgi:hypothetical protein
MHLVQILLPLYDNAGQPFSRELYAALARDLTARFGGLTAHTRAPAEGLWRESPGEAVRDDIVIYEVMAEAVDADWWRAFRARLERDFRQDAIVIRAQEVRLL